MTQDLPAVQPGEGGLPYELVYRGDERRALRVDLMEDGTLKYFLLIFEPAAYSMYDHREVLAHDHALAARAMEQTVQHYGGPLRFSALMRATNNTPSGTAYVDALHRLITELPVLLERVAGECTALPGNTVPRWLLTIAAQYLEVENSITQS